LLEDEKHDRRKVLLAKDGKEDYESVRTRADTLETPRSEWLQQEEEEENEYRQVLAEMQDEESKVLERLAFMDKAYETRRKPVQAELDDIRKLIYEQEMKIMNAEVGEEADGAIQGLQCLSWINGNLFSVWCSVVIVANLAVMILEMQDKEHKSLFSIFDNVFLAWYVCELSLKAAYLQRHLLLGACGTVWWNWLDLLIVTSGIMDQWLMPLLGSHGLGFSMSTLRVLRLLRLFRLARALKLLRVLFQQDLSWIEGQRFESFMMAVICVNAVLMWLELDYPCAAWFWVEHILLAIYTFELTMRMAMDGCAFWYNDECHWHILDFVIVSLGILEEWMLPIFRLIQTMIVGHTVEENTAFTHIVSVLRVIRVARVLRLARLLRAVKPLYKLMNGVVESLQSITWVMVLTFLLLYSCAIMFTTLVGEGYIFSGDVPGAAEEYYGTVFRSMLSLFKLMNDDQSMVEPILSTVVGRLLFCVFMMLSNWMMLAVLTSVISDNMMRGSHSLELKEQEDKREKDTAMKKRHLTELFQQIDQDKSGCISETELGALLQNPDLRGELCATAGLEMDDLAEVLNCVSYTTMEGDRVLLYRQFLHLLEFESREAKERSVFKLMERLRAMEFRLEKRQDAIFRHLGVEVSEVGELPSMQKELERVRQLDFSQDASLSRKITKPLSSRFSMRA